jgi:CspA family cold shock protein
VNAKVHISEFSIKGCDSMAKGTVTWFSEQKGYGLISPDGRGENIFVHYTDIVGSGFRSLKEGERVSYVPARGPRGRIVARKVCRTE